MKRRKLVPMWNDKKNTWDWVTPQQAETLKRKKDEAFASAISFVLKGHLR